MSEKTPNAEGYLPHEWAYINKIGKTVLSVLERMEYPSADTPIATFGSRVTLREDGDESFAYDLVTHPDAPDLDEDVVPVSPTSPLGSRIHGSVEHSIITWNTPGGTRRGEIVKVDQEAQRRDFESQQHSDVA
jgi:transcription elongation GreA/GreB family factor